VREIHECDGRAHDPVTMVVPLTPKPTRKAEPLFILETKTKVGSTVAKTPVPRTHPNIDETPTASKSHTHTHSDVVVHVQ
jgi:hypothetical protein